MGLAKPTSAPTLPTLAPTPPTNAPTANPSVHPTQFPSQTPSVSPTIYPREGMAIYAVNGWKDIDINYSGDYGHTHAGVVFCGYDYNSFCNIAPDSWSCNDPQSHCRDVLYSTTPPPLTIIPDPVNTNVTNPNTNLNTNPAIIVPSTTKSTSTAKPTTTEPTLQPSTTTKVTMTPTSFPTMTPSSIPTMTPTMIPTMTPTSTPLLQSAPANNSNHSASNPIINPLSQEVNVTMVNVNDNVANDKNSNSDTSSKRPTGEILIISGVSFILVACVCVGWAKAHKEAKIKQREYEAETERDRALKENTIRNAGHNDHRKMDYLSIIMENQEKHALKAEEARYNDDIEDNLDEFSDANDIDLRNFNNPNSLDVASSVEVPNSYSNYKVNASVFMNEME